MIDGGPEKKVIPNIPALDKMTGGKTIPNIPALDNLKKKEPSDPQNPSANAVQTQESQNPNSPTGNGSGSGLGLSQNPNQPSVEDVSVNTPMAGGGIAEAKPENKTGKQKLISLYNHQPVEISREDIEKDKEVQAQKLTGKPYTQFTPDEKVKFDKAYFDHYSDFLVTPEQYDEMSKKMGWDAGMSKSQNSVASYFNAFNSMQSSALKGAGIALNTPSGEQVKQKYKELNGEDFDETKYETAKTAAKKSAEEKWKKEHGGKIPFGGVPWEYVLKNDESGLLQKKISAYNEARGKLAVESSLYKKGAEMEAQMREFSPTNPNLKDSFAYSKIPSAMGSLAGFAMASAMTTPLGLPPGVAPAVLGSLTNSASQFDEAYAKTGSYEKAFEAYNVGALTGALEGVPFTKPFGKLFGTLASGTERTMLKGGMKLLEGGTEEGLQEFTSEVLNNASAKEIYDASRQVIDKNAWEAGAIGFITGGLLNAITGRYDKATPDEKKLLDEARKNIQSQSVELISERQKELSNKENLGTITPMEMRELADANDVLHNAEKQGVVPKTESAPTEQPLTPTSQEATTEAVAPVTESTETVQEPASQETVTEQLAEQPVAETTENPIAQNTQNAPIEEVQAIKVTPSTIQSLVESKAIDPIIAKRAKEFLSGKENKQTRQAYEYVQQIINENKSQTETTTETAPVKEATVEQTEVTPDAETQTETVEETKPQTIYRTGKIVGDAAHFATSKDNQIYQVNKGKNRKYELSPDAKVADLTDGTTFENIKKVAISKAKTSAEKKKISALTESDILDKDYKETKPLQDAAKTLGYDGWQHHDIGDKEAGSGGTSLNIWNTNKVTEVKRKKFKRKMLFSANSRKGRIVAKEPQSIEEWALQHFVSGETVKWEDIKHRTGYKWEDVNGNMANFSPDAKPLDLIAKEDVPAHLKGNRDEATIMDEIANVITSNPTITHLMERAEKLQETPTEEDIYDGFDPEEYDYGGTEQEIIAEMEHEFMEDFAYDTQNELAPVSEQLFQSLEGLYELIDNYGWALSKEEITELKKVFEKNINLDGSVSWNKITDYIYNHGDKTQKDVVKQIRGEFEKTLAGESNKNAPEIRSDKSVGKSDKRGEEKRLTEAIKESKLDKAKAKLDKALKDSFAANALLNPKDVYKIVGASLEVGYELIREGAIKTKEQFKKWAKENFPQLADPEAWKQIEEELDYAWDNDTVSTETGESTLKELAEKKAKELPEKTKKKKPKGTKKKTQALIRNTIKGRTEMSDETVYNLFERKQGYTPKSENISASEAKVIVDVAEQLDKVKQLTNDILDPRTDFKPDVRIAIGAQLISNASKKEKLATTREAKQKLVDYQVSLTEGLADLLVDYGRAGNAAKLFYTNMSPSARSEGERKTVRKIRDKELKQKEGNADAEGADKQARKVMEETATEAVDKAIDGKAKQAAKEAIKPQPEKKITRREAVKKLTVKLNALKVNLKPGEFNDITRVISGVVWNKAIDIVNASLTSGATLIDAIEAGLNHIRSNHDLPFDEENFSGMIREAAEGIEGLEEETLSANAAIRKASELDAKDLQKKLREIAVGHFSKANKFHSSLTDKIMDGINVEPEVAKKIADAISEEFNSIIEKKKAQIIKERFHPKGVSEKKAVEMLDKIIQAANLGVLSNETLKDTYAEALGIRTMSDTEVARIYALAETVQEADLLAEEFEEKYDSLTESEKKEYGKKWDAAKHKAAKAAAELLYITQNKDVWSKLAGILKRNLITATGLITNIISYPFFAIYTLPQMAVAHGLSAAISKTFGSPRMIDNFSKIKGAKAFIPGIKEGWWGIKHGAGMDILDQRDYMTFTSPELAIKDLRSRMSGKEKKEAGKIISDVIEATVGIPAEIVGRFLNFGDKPFRRMAELGEAMAIAKEKGLAGTELEKFLLFPDMESKKRMQDAGDVATFQAESIIASFNPIKKATGAAKDFLDGLPRIISGPLEVIAAAIIPFVQTPAAIAQMSLKYVMWEATFAYGVIKAGQYVVNGKPQDRKDAINAISAAGVGAGMSALASSMVAAGLVGAIGKGDDDDERKKGYAAGRDNTLNISGLLRWISGGSPAYQQGDNLFALQPLGLFGMQLRAHQMSDKRRKHDNMEAGLPIDANAGILDSYGQKRLTMASQIVMSTFEQSYMQGTSLWMDAFSSGDYSKIWLKLPQTLSNIVVPNQVSQAVNVFRIYKLDSKSPEMKSMEGVLKARVVANPEYAKLTDLWGQPVLQTPEGSTATIFNLFNPYKTKEVRMDAATWEVVRLHDLTLSKDVIPGDIKAPESLEKPLNSLELQKFKEVVGAARKAQVMAAIGDKDYEGKSTDDKIKSVNAAIERGTKIGTHRFSKQVRPLTKAKKVTPK